MPFFELNGLPSCPYLKKKNTKTWIHKVFHLGLDWLRHNLSAFFIISHLEAALPQTHLPQASSTPFG